jgi:UDP-3-O-[3-hydroxymyristoyl] N-acetylglucosamine deacetylase
MHFQRTVKDEVRIEGVGLHSGKSVRIRILPAKPDSGIVFMRADNGRQKIPLKPDRVVSTMNNTGLGVNGNKILTVEHLLSSFYGLGIDNALVEVFGEEIPILDGSAKKFVEEILRVGIEKLDKHKHFILVKKPLRVEEFDRYASIDPSPDFRVDFVISYEHPLLRYQRREFRFDGEDFEKEISPARTFGFINEVEVLRNNGLAKGGSLENVVVLSSEGVVNPEGMRFKDEPVRHKILDSLGDLMILGTHLIGTYRGYKSGHKLNHQLLLALLSDPENYQLIEADHPRLAKENGFKIPRWLTPKDNSAAA